LQRQAVVESLSRLSFLSDINRQVLQPDIGSHGSTQMIPEPQPSSQLIALSSIVRDILAGPYNR